MGPRRENRWSPPEHPETERPLAYTLSAEARGGDVCHAVTPAPVWAWIQFPTFHVRVKAFARSWTRDAVLVEWAQFGQQAQAWVWRSAVKHRTLRPTDPRTGRSTPGGRGPGNDAGEPGRGPVAGPGDAGARAPVRPVDDP